MVQNFQHFVREAEEGVAVTVLFDEGTKTEDEILGDRAGLTKRHVLVSRRLSMFQRMKHDKVRSFISNMMKFLSVNEIFQDPAALIPVCGIGFIEAATHRQVTEWLSIRCQKHMK